MTLITLREQSAHDDGSFTGTLSFDNGPEHTFTLRDPFAASEEAESEAHLEWYFEKWLELPFLNSVKAEQAAESIARYGVALFQQVFADPEAFAEYRQCTQQGLDTLCLEIAGSPEFHQFHWEALRDPKLAQPFALAAPMVRKNIVPQPIRATVRPSPTINLLVVVARPSGAHDVGYRTISRPLVETLGQAQFPVQVEFVRPGTYRALSDHLESKPAGYYHAIHFDVHGALLPYETFKAVEAQYKAAALLYEAPYGRKELPAYEGLKAFLFLEGEAEGKPDPVEASELAALLQKHQVPLVILNACQSGKQVGASETSLGSRLMQTGVQVALAMGYSVTVSAAEILMRTLYEQLFQGNELAEAIRRGRLELYNRKDRRAYYNQTIDLEDWVLPVVYQNQPVQLRPREMTAEERQSFYAKRADRVRFNEPAYAFVGRDLDILQIEHRMLTRRNLLLVRGMGGAGKTTLLRHLAAWWQTTGLVDRVFYFGYDERAWTLQQIMADIAECLVGEARYFAEFVPLGPAAQQQWLADQLRAHRHLLILDNLESITGAQLAIQHTLPPAERDALRAWLAELVDGKTLVLLGSRGGEEWLMERGAGGRATGRSPLQKDDVYPLAGLDPAAASTLAERILERHSATRYRTDEAYRALLKLLDGYPLALEVVLTNLERQTPGEVLAALQAGETGVDLQRAEADKTESILRCIEYSHGNLAPEAQALLACLAPFVRVFGTDLLPQHTERLRAQPALAGLPFDRWNEVLKTASDWGLVSPHPEIEVYLRLQPTLPYFLRNRLNDPAQVGTKQAIETAFREHYNNVGGALAQLLESKQPQERQIGQVLTDLEYENLHHALTLALAAQVSIQNPYKALSFYLDTRQDQSRGLTLGQMVLAEMENYPPERLQGELGFEFVGVIDDIARRYFLQKRYAEAEAAYQKALSLHLGLTIFEEKRKAILSAGLYHQLGYVAQEQRQWQQAERYYQQALQIYVEFNDRYEQASAYHQLGMVAQEQRQWAQAERYYQQALQLKIEFDDRYSQANTYHNLGVVAQEQRQWQEAERYYQQALQIKIEFNDRYSQARTYHQLGIVAQEQRQWQQAERYYQQALQIRIEFNDRYNQASTYHNLGIVAQEQRQWPQAERYYQQALQIYVEFNDRYEQAGTYHQLGRVAQEQRQWKQAERYYQQALQIKIEFNDRYSQASTYGQLGLLAEELGETNQAQDYLFRALEIFVAFHDEYNTAGTFRHLARLWKESGDDTLPSAVAKVLGVSEEEAREGMEEASDVNG